MIVPEPRKELLKELAIATQRLNLTDKITAQYAYATFLAICYPEWFAVRKHKVEVEIEVAN
jgi:hypothetical protein